MRPSLLDNMSMQDSASWNKQQSAVALGSPDDEFEELLATVLPCRTNDPELWFAEQAAKVEQAKALCRTCPLVAGCLAGALERQEPWGVWGGEVFVDGAIVARKRGRGRPSKADILARQEAVQAAAEPIRATPQPMEVSSAA